MLLQAVADKGIQSLVKSFYECIIRYTKYFTISLALPQNSTVTIVSVKFDTSMKIYIDLYKIVSIYFAEIAKLSLIPVVRFRSLFIP